MSAVATALILMVILPAGLLYLILKKTSDLEHLTDRFGPLYEGLKTNRSSSLLYNVVFLARRILIVLSAVFLQDYPTF